MENNFQLKVAEGKTIFVRCWEVKNPVAVLQIVHGMAEHSKRYTDFAAFLNKNGISVYAADHRGHGKNIENISDKGKIGAFGLERIADDQIKLTKFIKAENLNTPLFILGHSMGSFISQKMIQNNPQLKLNGLLLSGSNGSFGLELILGKYLARLIMLFGKERPSPLLDFLSFLSYNKKTEKKTSYDWLSSDQLAVKNYIKDPLCGGVLPANFYFSLFSLINSTLNGKNFRKMPNSMPVFIVSGSSDPFGKYGKGIESLYNKYVRSGVEDITIKLYKNSRHEVLNEINRLEVYQDILSWIKKHIKD